ncbi:MAG: GAF domain-containing protein, partial [Aggregatilineales bacterium]
MLSPLQLLIIALTIPIMGMLLLMLFQLRRKPRTKDRKFYWLVATLILSIVVCGVHLLPADWQLSAAIQRDFLIWFVLILTQITFSAVIIRDTLHYQKSHRIEQFFYGLGATWLIGFVILALTQSDPFSGWSDWNQQESFIAGLYGAAGGIFTGLLSMGFAFYNFYRTALPEVANRSAFMILLTGAHMLGFALISSVATSLLIPGLLVLILSLGGIVYTHFFYRVTDVRRGIIIAIRIGLITLCTWSLSFAALYFVYRADLSREPGNAILVGGIALIIAVLFIPVRQFIDGSFRYLMQRSTSTPELGTAIAGYTRNVASAASLEEVVQATTDTLNNVIRVSHSALILINTTYRVPDSVELIVLDENSSIESPATQGYLSRKSPVYITLAVNKAPLTLFDIEYNPLFKAIPPEEKQFFRSLKMRAYIPIVTDNRLIGLLSCGQKRNDTPF